MTTEYIKWFKDITLKDIKLVGGKNASLGEMISRLSQIGIKVPNGFALSTNAYRAFLEDNHLTDKIQKILSGIHNKDIETLEAAGKEIRESILKAQFSKSIETAISTSYQNLEQMTNNKNLAVAVRSSATTEDLENASFAGQHESFLNVVGTQCILSAVKKVFASLYNDRAIAYRIHNQISPKELAISVGIQQMVRSDKGASGVMFTLDTESGFDKVVFINAGYGLGELLVQGMINPDEYYLFKPSIQAEKKSIIRRTLGTKEQKLVLSESGPETTRIESVSENEKNQFVLKDTELEVLAKQACLIEAHYGQAMDIEWGKDGILNELFILQARPETIKAINKGKSIEKYSLNEKGSILTQGRSIGHRIGQGKARIITSIANIQQVQKGEVLVTDMTTPDWEPIMKQVSAIVTNRGGRTCHAAIIARELGIPAVIGCGDATERIRQAQAITVSSAEGNSGYVYEGLLKFEKTSLSVDKIPELSVQMKLVVANPDLAFDLQYFPNDGVGLVRLEFIITQMIGIHPKACLEMDTLPLEIQQKIRARIAGYASPTLFYRDKLVEGIATIAAAFWPKPVTVRLSDFKSNEYANLLGGELFESQEENPMLGYRGASRYNSPLFKESFALECDALKKARNELGLTNIEIMVPFVRTVHEAKGVVDLLQEFGIKRGENDLRLIMMCEIPSNILLAEEFLQYFDGYSIGSNDLTQLTLGIDRDSELVSDQFDERNPAVLKLLEEVIQICKRKHKSIGICGQGPSDYPDFAVWLVERGIDSISLNPDSVLSTWLLLAEKFRNAPLVSVN